MSGVLHEPQGASQAHNWASAPANGHTGGGSVAESLANQAETPPATASLQPNMQPPASGAHSAPDPSDDRCRCGAPWAVSGLRCAKGHQKPGVLGIRAQEGAGPALDGPIRVDATPDSLTLARSAVAVLGHAVAQQQALCERHMKPQQRAKELRTLRELLTAQSEAQERVEELQRAAQQSAQGLASSKRGILRHLPNKVIDWLLKRAETTEELGIDARGVSFEDFLKALGVGDVEPLRIEVTHRHPVPKSPQAAEPPAAVDAQASAGSMSRRRPSVVDDMARHGEEIYPQEVVRPRKVRAAKAAATTPKVLGLASRWRPVTTAKEHIK